MSDHSRGYRPQQGTSEGSSDEGGIAYLIRTLMLEARTSLPVEVVSVTNEGGVSPIGFVNIRPLVQQVDGEGNAVSHGIIYHVPYMRIQGGANAVILDPQAGDIGMAAFCDRDISAVVASKGEALPGSSRTFDMSDAIYLFTMLSGTPEQYVQFSESGITVHSPTKVTLEAPETEIISEMTFRGNSQFIGNVGTTGTLHNNGVDVGSGHPHSGVEPGSGNSGPPIS